MTNNNELYSNKSVVTATALRCRERINALQRDEQSEITATSSSLSFLLPSPPLLVVTSSSERFARRFRAHREYPCPRVHCALHVTAFCPRIVVVCQCITIEPTDNDAAKNDFVQTNNYYALSSIIDPFTKRPSEAST